MKPVSSQGPLTPKQYVLRGILCSMASFILPSFYDLTDSMGQNSINAEGKVAFDKLTIISLYWSGKALSNFKRWLENDIDTENQRLPC